MKRANKAQAITPLTATLLLIVVPVGMVALGSLYCALILGR